MAERTFTDFEFEFYSEEELPPTLKDQLRTEAESRLWELATGHSDMTGASVALSRQEHGETPHRHRARVVAYIKPDNIAAVEKGDTAMAAMQEALDAVQRQIRERRDKFREPWKRP